MNATQFKRLANKSKLPSPVILKTENGYLLGFELGETLELLRSINSHQVRLFKRADAALGAASAIQPLDVVTFRTMALGDIPQ